MTPLSNDCLAFVQGVSYADVVLTIKAAATQTGVPEATLRAWERRYAVVSPVRTPAGYRLYDEDTLRALREMHRLVEAGWAPSQAAAELLRRRAGRPGQAPIAAPPGEVGAPERWARELVAAARGMDAGVVNSLLDEAFGLASVEVVIARWLMPGLRELGEAWAAGEISIAGEHLVSHALLRRLSAAYEAAAASGVGVKVVVGLPASARHELGALAFAVLARRAGADVLYLGPDLLAREWVGAVTRHGAQAAVVVVPTTADAAAAREVVRAVRRSCPAVQVRVGGAGAAALRMAGADLGSDLAAAARDIVT